MRAFLTSSVDVVAKQVAQEIGKTELKLVFIYTAAEVEEGGKDADWCQLDRSSLVSAGFKVTDYTLTDKHKSDLLHDLSSFDVIYVSGGNTFYLLQQSQLSGFVDVVGDLVKNQGKIYIGSSAGSCIAGPDIFPTSKVDDPNMAPFIHSYVGYQLVNFCVLPHWGSDHFRESYLNNRLDFTYLPNQVPLMTLTDTQYVSVENDRIRIVETKKG